MYVIIVEFRIREGHEADFMARMREQAENSLSREEDCLQFDVCNDPENPQRVFLYEVYSDEDAFKRHLESAHFNDFDATTSAWIESKTAQAWQRQD